MLTVDGSGGGRCQISGGDVGDTSSSIIFGNGVVGGVEVEDGEDDGWCGSEEMRNMGDVALSLGMR